MERRRTDLCILYSVYHTHLVFITCSFDGVASAGGAEVSIPPTPVRGTTVTWDTGALAYWATCPVRQGDFGPRSWGTRSYSDLFPPPLPLGTRCQKLFSGKTRKGAKCGAAHSRLSAELPCLGGMAQRRFSQKLNVAKLYQMIDLSLLWHL